MTMSFFECPICYGSINLQDPHVKTKCNHDFCFECYTRHQYSGHDFSHTCPICRTRIKPATASPTPAGTSHHSRILLSLFDLPIQDEASHPTVDARWSNQYSDSRVATSFASPSTGARHNSRDSGVAQSPSHIHIRSPQTATSNIQEDLIPSFFLSIINNSE